MLRPLAIIAGAVAVYANSLAGVFLFDDRLHILDERRLAPLWPPWEVLGHRRPVVDYTFALNHAIHGETPWGYHAVNLSIHILAALALYGIVRRALASEPLRARYGKASCWFAFTIALIWTIHPLLTQSVTYLVQRAESLMGMFYLLTLYAVIRGVSAPRPFAWYATAVFCSAFGMGCKGVMVTAPVIVLLYDRTFLAGSFVRALRQRGLLYAGLAATWGVLWLSGVAPAALNPSTANTNVGFGFKGISPIDYALTQCSVLIEYLKLSVWPAPLCLDYFRASVQSIEAWLLPGLLILAALALTGWALIRRPALGFVGAWFFIILAPTSSIVPIRDPMFEHRMYLSLAAVVTLAVLSAHRLLGWIVRRFSLRPQTGLGIATCLSVTTIVCLGAGTVHRNRDYHSESGMWLDVLGKRPHSARAWENYGTALRVEGQLAEAVTVLQEAVRVNPRSVEAHDGLGTALAGLHRLDEAIDAYRAALRIKPDHRSARCNLGIALLDTGRTEEAIGEFQRALNSHPKDNRARLQLGNALLKQGRHDQAIEQYRHILEVDPTDASAARNIGTTLLAQGKLEEAVDAFRHALTLDSNSAEARNSLGITFASLGRMDEAVEAFRAALAINPTSGKIHADYGKTLLIAGRLEESVQQYRAAIQLEPGKSDYHYELGIALGRLGNIDGAIEQYRQTLQLNPRDADARQALDRTLTRRQQGPG